MKNRLSLFLALIVWFALIAQYFLMIQNKTTSTVEATIRFFSFFTILTNSLVALYFTAFFLKSKWVHKAGTLTAIAVYISIVGLVYQVALRHIWHPEGLQRIVDELLHSIIPIIVVIFWSIYEKTKSISYSQILKWAIYPFLYFVYTLIHGHFSNFYPYPFINVTELGIKAVAINSGIILVLFLIISSLFIFIGKSIIKR